MVVLCYGVLSVILFSVAEFAKELTTSDVFVEWERLVVAWWHVHV